MRSAVLLGGFVPACALCWAQPAAASNVPGAEYPRVHSDLRVTFRLRAPESRSVAVQL
jgi:hypothetical protein